CGLADSQARFPQASHNRGSAQPIMHTDSLTVSNESRVPAVTPPVELAATAPGGVRVIRRNGKVTAFDASKIQIALTKAFLAVEGGTHAESSAMREKVDSLTASVVSALTRHLSGGGTVHI